MKTTALIDADILVYVAAFHNQDSYEWVEGEDPVTVADEESSYHMLEDLVDEIKEAVKADDYIMCLSCPASEGWRRKVLPDYKLNRSGKEPPLMRQKLIKYIKDNMPFAYMDSFEGDDCMGILMTHPDKIKGHKVICSSDKDMKTIVGDHYDFKHKERFYVGEDEAYYWHMFQTLTGDTTDNYKGCPRIGQVKAEKILSAVEPPEYWKTVVETFAKAGCTEEEALVQARVAKICQWTDVNYDSGEVILWTPPKEEEDV